MKTIDLAAFSTSLPCLVQLMWQERQYTNPSRSLNNHLCNANRHVWERRIGEYSFALAVMAKVTRTVEAWRSRVRCRIKNRKLYLRMLGELLFQLYRRAPIITSRSIESTPFAQWIEYRHQSFWFWVGVRAFDAWKCITIRRLLGFTRRRWNVWL
jgi:hypothetical protein